MLCKKAFLSLRAPNRPLLLSASCPQQIACWYLFFGEKNKSSLMRGSTTLYNEGSLLSQRWRGNYTNKLLWDIHNGVMSEMLWLTHAGVNCKVCLRVAIWNAIGVLGQTWVHNNLSSCLSNDQPESLSSEWGSVVSPWGLDEGQILVQVEVRG